jgi:hypothetical protein
LLKTQRMNRQHVTYYADIAILVDGWPWNLSEFDYRRWFAPGSCPRTVEATEIAGEFRAQKKAQRHSENRRVPETRKDRVDRRTRSGDRRRKAA